MRFPDRFERSTSCHVHFRGARASPSPSFTRSHTPREIVYTTSSPHWFCEIIFALFLLRLLSDPNVDEPPLACFPALEKVCQGCPHETGRLQRYPNMVTLNGRFRAMHTYVVGDTPVTLIRALIIYLAETTPWYNNEILLRTRRG